MTPSEKVRRLAVRAGTASAAGSFFIQILGKKHQAIARLRQRFGPNINLIIVNLHTL